MYTPISELSPYVVSQTMIIFSFYIYPRTIISSNAIWILFTKYSISWYKEMLKEAREEWCIRFCDVLNSPPLARKKKIHVNLNNLATIWFLFYWLKRGKRRKGTRQISRDPQDSNETRHFSIGHDFFCLFKSFLKNSKRSKLYGEGTNKSPPTHLLTSLKLNRMLLPYK